MNAEPRSRAERGTAGLVVLALGAPAVTAVVLAAWVPEDGSWPLAGVLVALCALGLWAALLGGRALRGPTVALSVLGGLVAWPEIGLRAGGFRFHPAGVVQFGYPRPTDLVGLAPDEELFWKLAPEAERVNAHGFVGPDFELPKPAGTLRLVFLGDSCTWQGFPEFVAEDLEADPAAWQGRSSSADGAALERVEALNLGVPGYTSHQGRILAERWLGKLEPDLGFVLYGWNDHWRAYGAIDSKRRAAGPRLASAAARSRLAQWIASRAAREKDEPLDEVRVPLEEYRANLQAIGTGIERSGGKVVLVTAPSAHARRGVPEYLVARGFVADEASALELHARYNDAVRALAGETGWRLADCERALAEDPAADTYFRVDGIHFTEEGARWMGAFLAGTVRTELASR